MKALGWVHRIFRKNINEQSRNVPTRKSYSCFTTPREFDEQQYYPSFVLEARKVEEANQEEKVDMSPEFFHGFLAIGTLGSISVTKEAITPEVSMPFESVTEEDTGAEENESQSLNKKSEAITENEVDDVSNESSKGRVVTLNEKNIKGIDIKENKGIFVLSPKTYYEMPAIKEEAREQKSTPGKLFKKDATSDKRSGKLHKGEKKETRALFLMKKMMKNLHFTSQCSLMSVSDNAIFCDSTEKKSTKEFRKSRKVHPEAADIQVPKSHNYEVKNMCYDEGNDKEVGLEEEDKLYPYDGSKAHWIKTDADYFVLEF